MDTTDTISIASSNSGYAQFLSFFYGSGDAPALKSSKNTMPASQLRTSQKSEITGVEIEAPSSTDSLSEGDEKDRER